MHTRKVQQLSPSTLAVTLPAEWARNHNVEKGTKLPIYRHTTGELTISPSTAHSAGTEATLTGTDVGAAGLERAIIAQYVLGRRVIHVTDAGVLDNAAINAVYNAETQLMGVGVVEETPERITIRCSANPEDFTLDNLLQRLENTGRTMRNEAMDALLHNTPDVAQRALNRERQANKIFVLLLRLIFTAQQNPTLLSELGLDDRLGLLGYRAVAKNLELIADNAQDLAEIVVSVEGTPLDRDEKTRRRISEFTETVDELTGKAIEAVLARDYETTVDVRTLFGEIDDRERDILHDLPEMENADLLAIRDVLVSLQQTAQYAMRNAEVATNLAVYTESSDTDASSTTS